MRNYYKLLVEKTGGKRELGRLRRRGENIIKMYLKEVGFVGVHWILLAQSRDCRRALVNTVKYFCFFNFGNFLTG
jgi:hypothetical protein